MSAYLLVFVAGELDKQKVENYQSLTGFGVVSSDQDTSTAEFKDRCLFSPQIALLEDKKY